MPDDSVRVTLRAIVQQYGPISNGADLRQWRGLLRDLMGGYKLEMNLLLFALEIGAPERIAASAANPELALPRLAMELEQMQGVSAENAQWSVATWAFAMGLNLVSAQPEQKHLNNTKTSASRQEGYHRDQQAVQNSSLLHQSGIVWIHIPAGKFLYGTDKQSIHVDAFWIAKTPVTNLQYQAFVDAAGFRKPDHWKDGKIPAGKKDHPVVNVSWYDAVAFCEWAGLRLPTEAEWEKAARGTDGRTYPWGEAKPDRRRCNFNNNVGDTTPVGNYPAGASPYGVLDMAGNVWEWVLPVINLNPPRLKIGEFRVLRGGSWSRNDDGVRSTYQYISNPHYWDSSIGFRCVRSP